MDADGSGQTRLTDNDGGWGWPTWSADGAKIAFMTDRDGNWEILSKVIDDLGQQGQL